MRFNIGGDRSKLDSAAKCHRKCIMTDYSSEDVGEIVLLEHVNLQVPDQTLAPICGIVGSGSLRDTYFNVGVRTR